jgi:hypothetical protein
MSMIASFAAADRPVIFWTPDFGAVIVRGAMNAAWAKVGAAKGDLGAPTADQTENGDVITQKFNGGAISWNKKTNEFTTEPPALAAQLKGLVVPGRDVPQAPPAAESPASGGSKWFRPSSWWLLGIVPVVVLVGVVAAAVLLSRRRQDDRAPLDGFDDDEDDDDDYDYDDRGFESGPIPSGDYGDHDGDGDSGRRSTWAMPVDKHGDLPSALRRGRPDGFVADLSSNQDAIDTAPTPIVAESESEADPESPWFSDLDDHDDDDDLDDLDDLDDHGDHGDHGDHDDHDAAVDDVLAFDEAAAVEPEPEAEPEPDSGPPSGRHAAIQLDEPVVSETSLRLASEDPFDAPHGYPIKADTKTGHYWTPGSGRYDDVRAEIWFASEEFALTNGFTRG